MAACAQRAEAGAGLRPAGAARSRRGAREEAEATLDAEVAERDVVVGHARHLDDPVVLHVELERAADAAVRADRLGHLLVLALPGRAKLVLKRNMSAPVGQTAMQLPQ